MNLRDVPVEAQTISLLPTRYFGSKRRQIAWLATELRQIKGSTAIDPFGGTGTVSAALGAIGFSVTFCDIFRFNEISARAMFCRAPLQLQRHIDILNAVVPQKGFIAETFSGKYYTDSENQWLDGFASEINELEDKSIDKAALFYAVFQACLKKRPYNLFHRANLNLRTSNVSKSFGNWYTWRKSFSEHATQALQELASFRANSGFKVQVLKSRCATKHSGYYDLIYIDPPYFKREKLVETYLQRYHFLEGLSNYELWPKWIDDNSALKSFQSGCAPSEWSAAKDIVIGIEKILSRIDSKSIALSYVEGQAPSAPDLTETISKYFKKVQVRSCSTLTALSKNARTELLIIGEGRR